MSIELFPALTSLADKLAVEADRLPRRWELAHAVTAQWLADQPDLLDLLREHFQTLSPLAAAEVAAGSRETTTHFAWLLAAIPQAPYSFWLHEYKPQRDWWQGYANTVHNHRYHFCTTVLTGGFQHEWYEVTFDPTGTLIRDIVCDGCEIWRPGPVQCVTANQFHRLAMATDGTLTFLVKSRAVRGWSTSIDPVTKISRRHVPVEERIHDLANRI
jgi:hypothetical protein